MADNNSRQLGFALDASNPIDGFVETYETAVFASLSDVQTHLGNGFSNADLIPFFLYGKGITLTGAVTAEEAISNRTIEIDGRSASISQAPALITSASGKNRGKKVYRHVGEREDSVLDALKYIASHSGSKLGQFQSYVALRFTLGEVARVLGTSYSKVEIKEALDVLNKSPIEITTVGSDGKIHTVSSTLLPSLVSAEDPQFAELFTDRSTLLCTFHPFVTSDLANMNVRRVDTLRILSRRSSIAKYIEKRLSHVYIQASESKLYTIKASNILLGGGFHYHPDSSTRDNFRYLLGALNELTIPEHTPTEISEDEMKSYILKSVDLEPVHSSKLGGRKRIVDYKITMHPSELFIKQQISANASANEDKQRLELARNLRVQPSQVSRLSVKNIKKPATI